MSKDWKGNGNSIWKTLGASNHTDKDREPSDFYSTSPRALELFYPKFQIHHKVWEPACGDGSLSEWLCQKGHEVLSSDLVDRGYGTYGIDFLKVEKDNEVLSKWAGGTFDILTNPPYKYAADFILHALDLIPDDGRVIMFLKTTFLEGKQRKNLIYDINPPRYVFQYSERILCAKNGDFDYMRRHGGSAVSYAMYVWNKQNDEKKNRGKMDIGNGQIYNDDCFNVFPKIADKSVDMVLCDLPYSRSASKWDKPLDLGMLWEQYKRIVKDDRAIVLFATQPFTTELISSNTEIFKYSWVWFKHSAPNFLNAKTMPLKVTEDICVFGFKPVSYNKKKEYMLYNPQFSQGKPYTCKSGKQKADTAIIRDRADAKSKMGGVITQSDGRRYPTTLLDYTKDKEHFHSTQKPVELLRYLIRTYSNEGDLILDNTAGSMSTAIAAIREKRRFLMVEKDEHYFEIGKKRIEDELKSPILF